MGHPTTNPRSVVVARELVVIIEDMQDDNETDNANYLMKHSCLVSGCKLMINDSCLGCSLLLHHDHLVTK